MPEPITLTVAAYEFTRFLANEIGKTLIRPYLAKSAQRLGLVPGSPGSEIAQRISGIEQHLISIRSHLEQDRLIGLYSGWSMLCDIQRSKDLNAVPHAIARFHAAAHISSIGSTAGWKNREIRCLAFLGIAHCYQLSESDPTLVQEYIQKCFAVNPPLAADLLDIKTDIEPLKSILNRLGEIEEIFLVQNALCDLHGYLLDKTAQSPIIGKQNYCFPPRVNIGDRERRLNLLPSIIRDPDLPNFPIIYLSLKIWEDSVIGRPMDVRVWRIRFPKPSELEEITLGNNCIASLMKCDKYKIESVPDINKVTPAKIYIKHFMVAAADVADIYVGFTEPMWEYLWDIRLSVDLKNWHVKTR